MRRNGIAAVVFKERRVCERILTLSRRLPKFIHSHSNTDMGNTRPDTTQLYYYHFVTHSHSTLLRFGDESWTTTYADPSSEHLHRSASGFVQLFGSSVNNTYSVLYIGVILVSECRLADSYAHGPRTSTGSSLLQCRREQGQAHSLVGHLKSL